MRLNSSEMTQRLEAALRRRYEESSPGEWLLLSEVFLGDGHVDFVAVNLWRARGNRILGFEVKGSRGDCRDTRLRRMVAGSSAWTGTAR